MLGVLSSRRALSMLVGALFNKFTLFLNMPHISNAVVENDDVLWNGSEEDGHVRSECEEDEGTDCEDGDSDTDWYR